MFFLLYEFSDGTVNRMIWEIGHCKIRIQMAAHLRETKEIVFELIRCQIYN